MKVGILTFPHSPSYGASLQMFALHEAVKAQGYTPYIFNYQNKYMLKKQHMGHNIIKAQLSNLISHKTIKNFQNFEKRLNWFPQKTIQSCKTLKDYALSLDYIIVGSDQVWNPDVTGCDTTYYLDFCEDNKKISYAASFGVDSLKNDFAEKVSDLIVRIPSLSIREEKGAEIIKSLTGRDATIVLDPTFLHSKDVWHTVAAKKQLVKQPYIFSFIFNPNKENLGFRDELSKKTGLPIVSISDNPLSKSNANSIYVSGVGPLEFLNLIQNAEYVVTDSFHGTAFSIIFNKQFFVSLSTKTNSRLETLLSTLGLDVCVISHVGKGADDINYAYVNEKISELRSESLQFLRASLTGENANE